jgi:hypothetical protein
MSQEFVEQYNLTWEENPFSSKLRGYTSFPIFETPLIFKTEEEFMNHITSESYENFPDLEADVSDGDLGICFAVKIEDNLSTLSPTVAPKIDVKIFLEMMDGVTPAAGRRGG